MLGSPLSGLFVTRQLSIAPNPIISRASIQVALPPIVVCAVSISKSDIRSARDKNAIAPKAVCASRSAPVKATIASVMTVYKHSAFPILTACAVSAEVTIREDISAPSSSKASAAPLRERRRRNDANDRQAHQ